MDTVGSHPTPPWLSPDAIAHRNNVNGTISIIAIIVGLLLLRIAMRCYKKYKSSNHYLGSVDN